MPEKLTLEQARALARTLSTIKEFPRYEEAIEATAQDLIRWCCGADIEGRHWTPAFQASWLVTEAREKMTEWDSTAALLALFKQKFVAPKTKLGNSFIDYSNEPCICGSGKKFKDCCKPKPDEEPPPAPPPPKRAMQQAPSVNSKPITQEDVERELLKKKK